MVCKTTAQINKPSFIEQTTNIANIEVIDTFFGELSIFSNIFIEKNVSFSSKESNKFKIKLFFSK